MTWVDIWAAVLPPLIAALLTVISAAAALAVSYLGALKRRYDEASNREALHSALSTGVAGQLDLKPDASDVDLIKAGVRHALHTGSPDAIKAFKLGHDELATLARAKIPEARALAAETKPC